MLLLLPLILVPAGTRLLVDWMLGGHATLAARTAAALGLAIILLLPTYLLVIKVYCQRPDGGRTAVLAAASGITIAFSALQAAGDLLLSEIGNFSGEGIWVALLEMLLFIPLVWLALGLLRHWEIIPAWPWRAGLGLERVDRTAIWLALAISGCLTLPWPVWGALGDSLTSLSIVVQSLVNAAMPVLLFWGLIQRCLLAVFDSPRTAVRWTILCYLSFQLVRVLFSGDWGAAVGVFRWLLLACLLSLLDARPGGVYPLLLVTFFHSAIPTLLVDPRDLVSQAGIPLPEHFIARSITFGLLLLAVLALWLGRRKLANCLTRPKWIAGLAAASWGVWLGLYVTLGNPAFANDGLLILLAEQADLDAAKQIAGREARLQYVYDALTETAQRSQIPLRAELERLGVPYRPYYIINMIRVDGHRWLRARLAELPGVAAVLLNPNVREYPNPIPFPELFADDAPPGVQANLAAIHVDRVWALGVAGEGMVVAGQDTGFEWGHPALMAQYRGWDGRQADHDYNWHDAWNQTAAPFDVYSHGTHTMGIMVGDDGGANRIGLAPDARWIGCRGMRHGFGNPASYAECLEFFLAPYPHGGDPFVDGEVSMAPHVVANAWLCPDFEGCGPHTLEPAFQALRAAGIMTVSGAGNEGPTCNTVSETPAHFDSTLAVGAVDNSGQVTRFSSRGPAGDTTKPDLTAPGYEVRSSVIGGRYALNSGTSMAAPHVAGLVALIWSAYPQLIGQIEETEALLCQTAVPRAVEAKCTAEDSEGNRGFPGLRANSVCACGGVSAVPNNVYGCGLVDAEVAIQAVRE